MKLPGRIEKLKTRPSHGLYGCSRISGILLCLLFLLLSKVLASQEKVILRYEAQNKALKSILSEVSALYNVEFAYSDTEIKSNRILSISIQAKDTLELLENLCIASSISHSKLGGKILLQAAPSLSMYSFSGKVLELSGGTPVPGAHIALEGSPTGSVADANGMFSIDVPGEGAVIKISCMGFISEEYFIQKDTFLTIRLRTDIKNLEETVVVAFGEERKDLVSGAVSHVRMNTYDHPNALSLANALQAEVPGLLIQPNGGTPASALNISVRGISSITARNKPLFVVDGIPVITGDYSQLDFSGQAIDALSDISINDVESVSVLKDAAASSLYGSNSSNGVILINTYRGLPNKNQIEFHSYYGWQKTTGRLHMLNARQWMNLINEQAGFNGNPPVYSEETIEKDSVDTDWQKQVFQTAPVTDMGISLRGGNENSGYYLSANYFDQQGILIGSGFKRYNLRMNYDHQFNKRLKLEAGNSFAYSINNRVEGDQTLNGPLPNAITMPPIYPVNNPDGSYNNDGPYANPVSIAKLEKNLAYTYRNTFHSKINFLLFRNFNVRSLSGLDFFALREETFAPKTTRQGAKYNGLGIEGTSSSLRFYHTSFVDYFWEKSDHSLSLTAGISMEANKQHDIFLRAQNFAGTSFEFLQDAATPITTQSFETNSTSNSLFSKWQYNYSDRYILTLNMRRDGSSKFGRNNRFGFFPSLSGLWYASREKFFNIPTLTRLIFSASYGITGNDQIDDFLALDLFSAGFNYAGEGGIAPSQLANPNLKWESTRHLNLGMRAEIWQKLDLKIEFYQKKTQDLLLQKPLPSSTGYPYIMANIGKMENSGMEAYLSFPLVEGTFHWRLWTMITANKNKVTELYNNQPIRNIGRASSSIEVGEPLSFFYGFHVLGVNPDDGNLIYEDINKDGRITDLDRKKIGSPHPDFFGSFGTNLNWKGWSLHLNFAYSQGNEIFNSTRIYTETISIGNQQTSILRRWKNPGDITDVPKASVYNQRISSRFVEDGSFLRLRNLKWSYNWPEKYLSATGLTAVQIFFSASNLLTFTRYSGMDPEVNYNGINSIALGTDFFTCPQPKSFLFGICVRI